MSIKELLKQNPTKAWKWATIILVCLLFLQTCSKCSGRQQSAFESVRYEQTVDSLNTRLHEADSIIIILDNELSACRDAGESKDGEITYLRGMVEKQQSRPVILYKEVTK